MVSLLALRRRLAIYDFREILVSITVQRILSVLSSATLSFLSYVVNSIANSTQEVLSSFTIGT